MLVKFARPFSLFGKSILDFSNPVKALNRIIALSLATLYAVLLIWPEYISDYGGFALFFNVIWAGTVTMETYGDRGVKPPVVTFLRTFAMILTATSGVPVVIGSATGTFIEPLVYVWLSAFMPLCLALMLFVLWNTRHPYLFGALGSVLFGAVNTVTYIALDAWKIMDSSPTRAVLMSVLMAFVQYLSGWFVSGRLLPDLARFRNRLVRIWAFNIAPVVAIVLLVTIGILLHIVFEIMLPFFAALTKPTLFSRIGTFVTFALAAGAYMFIPSGWCAALVTMTLIVWSVTELRRSDMSGTSKPVLLWIIGLLFYATIGLFLYVIGYTVIFWLSDPLTPVWWFGLLPAFLGILAMLLWKNKRHGWWMALTASVAYTLLLLVLYVVNRLVFTGYVDMYLYDMLSKLIPIAVFHYVLGWWFMDKPATPSFVRLLLGLDGTFYMAGRLLMLVYLMNCLSADAWWGWEWSIKSVLTVITMALATVYLTYELGQRNNIKWTDYLSMLAIVGMLIFTFMPLALTYGMFVIWAAIVVLFVGQVTSVGWYYHTVYMKADHIRLFGTLAFGLVFGLLVPATVPWVALTDDAEKILVVVTSAVIGAGAHFAMNVVFRFALRD